MHSSLKASVENNWTIAAKRAASLGGSFELPPAV